MKKALIILSLFASFGLMSSGYAQTPHNKSVTSNQEAAKKNQPIRINSVNAKALAHKVKGIGAVRAKAVVAYRDAHGRFKSIDDLTHVKGISKRTLAKYRDVWQKSLSMD